jgi:hypothetical protein
MAVIVTPRAPYTSVLLTTRSMSYRWYLSSAIPNASTKTSRVTKYTTRTTGTQIGGTTTVAASVAAHGSAA